MRNLKINKGSGVSELELSPDFYPERILRKAANDFGKVFNADIKKRGERLIVRLKIKREGTEVEKATCEFMNYLLAEVKNETVRV